MSDDPEIVLKLPLSTVSVVLSALGVCRYCDVASAIAEIQRQMIARSASAALPVQSSPTDDTTSAEQPGEFFTSLN